MLLKLREEDRKRMKSSEDVHTIIKRYVKNKSIIDREKEHFFVLGLVRDGVIRFIEVVSIGSVSATIINPMNVFRMAVMNGVSSIIICHNHPSGNTNPSDADICITKKLVECGHIVLQLQEVGDFGDENCLPPLNLPRSTKRQLTTEPPISCRCCYSQCLFFVLWYWFVFHKCFK